MQHLLIDPAGAMKGVARAFVVPDSREAIEAAVEAMIERLDALEGDTDLEDATGLEDAFEAHPGVGHGPGCLVTDCGEEDDHAGDYASEDDPTGYAPWSSERGPGCPIADPGGCDLGI